jgi:hypothetical protein
MSAPANQSGAELLNEDPNYELTVNPSTAIYTQRE